VSPDQASPLQGGGLHAGGYHAIEASTPRNGVRTAVEDFLAKTDGIAFFDIIGFHGLGLLVSESGLARNPALRELLEEFQSPAWLREQCRRIEASRVRFQLRLEELAQGGPPKRWARRVRDRLSSRRGA
jgi:hypothetical protein